MRLPTGAPHRRLRAVVRRRVEAYSITRPAGNIGALGESRSTTTTHNADLWLFRASEVPLETDFGERLTGSLGGLALPGTDVQEGDLLTWNGDRYRVAEVVDTQDSVVLRIGLERATND